MRAVIQRVTHAELSISGKVYSQISNGFLVLLGIEEADNEQDIVWLAEKILNLRVFDDAQGVMNWNISQVGGELMVVSQFTLFASTKKGNRPSYLKSAKPPIAEPLYQRFVQTLQQKYPQKIQTGVFGADMQISLCNDGPVTLIIDTQNKE